MKKRISMHPDKPRARATSQPSRLSHTHRPSTHSPNNHLYVSIHNILGVHSTSHDVIQTRLRPRRDRSRCPGSSGSWQIYHLQLVGDGAAGECEDVTFATLLPTTHGVAHLAYNCCGREDGNNHSVGNPRSSNWRIAHASSQPLTLPVCRNSKAVKRCRMQIGTGAPAPCQHRDLYASTQRS